MGLANRTVMSNATKTGNSTQSPSMNMWVTKTELTLSVVEGCFEKLSVLIQAVSLVACVHGCNTYTSSMTASQGRFCAKPRSEMTLLPKMASKYTTLM